MNKIKAVLLTILLAAIAGTALAAYIPSGQATQTYTVKRNLSSAEILSLNGTPITIVSAPGSGKAIMVIGTAARINYNSVAYVAAGVVGLYQGAGVQYIFPTFLAGTATTIVQGAIVTPTMVENTALTASITVANPITGNSTVDIYVTYQILTL